MAATAREEVEPGSRAEWRRWLEEHHGTSPGVWLISYAKRTGRRRITVEEAQLEALCFGWIDSTLRPLPDGRSALRFTPRRRGSTWSKLNKERVAALAAEGLLAEAGRRAVAAAERDGSWNLLDDVEALRVPGDLATALAADPRASAHFDAFPPSARKQALWWIQSAKRPETRARRIAETVRLAAENLTLAGRPRKPRPSA